MTEISTRNSDLTNIDLFQSSPIATICVSEPGDILAANRSAQELLGVNEQILLTKPLITFIQKNQRRRLNTYLYEVKEHKVFQSEFNVVQRFGKTIPCMLQSRVVYDNDRYVYSIISLIDISEQKNIEDSLTKTQEELHYLAHHDSLTNLPNRYLLQDRLESAIIRTKRNGWLGALVFADIDRFKVINDDYGHHVGDEVLKQVSQRLKSVVRAQDTVCRYSGDEFILILEDITCETDAKNVIHKILEVFDKPISGLIEHPLKISTSLGVCLFDKFDSQSETIVKKADYAMYESKKRGRSCYTFYSAEHSINQNLDMIIENDLSVAIAEDQFDLYFQPQFNTRNGNIDGIEALTRWNHPTRGLVQPKDFIPRMENANLSQSLTEWVLKEACKKANKWLEDGCNFKYIAVNIAPRDFSSKQLIHIIENALTESGLPPHKLELELTESSILQNPNLATKILHDIQQMGIRLSLDDFGTGYSALSYLNDYPFNCIKIDKTFIDKLPFNQKSSALVDAIISIARSLGMDILAEGVESASQKDYLIQKGCVLMQGFLFSRPVSEHQMMQLLFDKKKTERLSLVNTTA